MHELERLRLSKNNDQVEADKQLPSEVMMIEEDSSL
jgi:hypothetical protein